MIIFSPANWRQALLRSAFALLALMADARAETAIDIKRFFEDTNLNRLSFSPDGKTIAAIATDQTQGRKMLVTMSTDTLVPKVAVRYTDADVINPVWMNNQVLFYKLTDRLEERNSYVDSDELYAVDKDTNKIQEYGFRSVLAVTHEEGKQGAYLTHTTRIGMKHDQLQQRSMNTVFVKASDALVGKSYLPLHRPGNVQQWYADAKGRPRIVRTMENDITSFYLLEDPDSTEWKKTWRKFHSYPGFNYDMLPIIMGDESTLYVTVHNKGDFAQLYRYDLKKNALDPKPILALDNYDFSGSLVLDPRTGQLLGVHYENDASGSHWLTPELRALQASIDAKLPDTINHIQFSLQENPVVLVFSSSSTEPGQYRLYHRGTDKFTPLGRRMPGIDAKQMAPMQAVQYKARDGLPISAYLTLPLKTGAQKPPLIVLVHGGPQAREHWEWDAQVQFLASRGYAVLQADYRGSEGYGKKHLDAGNKQWGLAMQDDLADGVKWAVAQGHVDGSRVCIAGASYGGYATLMGLIRDPQLYRCGVAWVAVSDWDLMFDSGWNNHFDETDRFYLPKVLGDRQADKARLDATSPLRNAAKLTQPLLLAHGELDRRVPIQHSIKLRAALPDSNKNVEWIKYPDEGHGWFHARTRIDFWSRVEKFLARHLNAQPVVGNSK